MNGQAPEAREAVAFAGERLIGAGELLDVALQAKDWMDRGDTAPILVFDRFTSDPIDLDWRGTGEDVVARLKKGPAEEGLARSRGRPKLGVTSREVTLLPRHWSWLSQQPGGASAALRRLVDQSRQTHRQADEIRQARQSTYRFITAMAGDQTGYEEAIRALFAGDAQRFSASIEGWPQDVRRHAENLAAAGFERPSAASLAWAPKDREGVVRHALAAAFGERILDAADPIAGGASSAGLWRLRVAGAHYVLRLDRSAAAVRDAGRHFESARIAAQGGLAPRLLYADPQTGVSISAFIEASSAVPPLSREQRLTAVADAVARLHAGPKFAAEMDYFDVLAGIMTAFADRGILPQAIASKVLAGFNTIRSAYPNDVDDLVSSHNDLNPGNVIFQGAHPRIVDWESAFVAPRYVDLAALATFQAIDEADVTLILTQYFGRRADRRQRARFFLMRQVNRLFYGAMLLTAADPQMRLRLTEEEIQAYRLDSLRDQMSSLVTDHGRMAFGCAFLNQAVHDLQTETFKLALSSA